MEIVYRTDAEFVHQVQDELYKQKLKKKLHGIDLPCKHARMQVDNPNGGMTAIECPVCHKVHYLIMVSHSKPKWRNE